MDSILPVLPTILKTSNAGLDIYLDNITEQICNSQDGIYDICESISALLLKANTKYKGLKLLTAVFPWLSEGIYEDKLHSWMTLILKSSNMNEIDSTDLFYDTLKSIAITSQNIQEMKKNFTSYLSKVYEVIISSPTACHISANQCLEVCLRCYPGPSASYKVLLVNFLNGFIDTHDENLNVCVAKNYHLIQQIGGDECQGMNKKNKWKEYQLYLLESLDMLLKMFFSNCANIYNETTFDKKAGETIPDLKLSSDPELRSFKLFIRIRNLTKYLEIALCEPFSANKTIMPKKILDLVDLLLCASFDRFAQNISYDNIVSSVFLPKMQLQILELMETLLKTLQHNLRCHNEVIFCCLIHFLKTISIGRNPLRQLRIKVYKIIILWCKILRETSLCELFADNLVSEIYKDIRRVNNDVPLQTHISDQKKRSQHHINDGNTVYQCQLNSTNCFPKKNGHKNNYYLCMMALRCLKYLVLSCSNFLKPNILKDIQITILRLCASLFTVTNNDTYNDYRCRLEIYKLMIVLLHKSHQVCPPPSDVTLWLIQMAKSIEGNLQTRSFCTKSVAYMENVIHPYKESLLYPINAKEIRNSFVMLGNERLLDEPLFPILNRDNLEIETDIGSIVTHKETQKYFSEYNVKPKCNIKSTIAQKADLNPTNVLENKPYSFLWENNSISKNKDIENSDAILFHKKKLEFLQNKWDDVKINYMNIKEPVDFDKQTGCSHSKKIRTNYIQDNHNFNESVHSSKNLKKNNNEETVMADIESFFVDDFV